MIALLTLEGFSNPNHSVIPLRLLREHLATSRNAGWLWGKDPQSRLTLKLCSNLILSLAAD